MSADSSRRGSKFAGYTVRPKAANDKSVMDSVVGFIQDVAYSHSTPKQEEREKVQWCYFEETNLNDISPPDKKMKNRSNSSTMLLVIGYTNGVQIYAILPNGDAQEVMSLRQGPVKELKLLPTPKNVFDRSDMFANKRPLMALCDGASAGQPFCCVKMVSLLTGDEMKCVSFKQPVNHIKCNDRVLLVVLHERIAVYDACQFNHILKINTCYPCPVPTYNPVALGSRWMAYADRKLVSMHQSQGGVTGDSGQSYTATVFSAAKTLQKGLSMFGETVSSMAGMNQSPTMPPKNDTGTHTGNHPGVVTIVDIQGVHQAGLTELVVREDTDGLGIVAHFSAHASEPLVALQFDPAGTLLLTADRLGHQFHLFRILPHLFSSSLGAVHHLYTLYRGDTTALVQGISFTHDSRWVAISTMRGTTHVFPITTYGGPVSVRTHCSRRVPNKNSRFHRSAGLDELNNPLRTSGRQSPVTTSNQPSPGSSPGRRDYLHGGMQQSGVHNIMSNPRLPPYPHPCTVLPLVQIKHSFNIPGVGAGSMTAPTPGGSTKAYKTSTSNRNTNINSDVCVAAHFAQPRGWVAGSPNPVKDNKVEKKAVDSLFVMNWMGQLVEHILDPRAKSSADKVSDDSAFEVGDTTDVQWLLGRCMSQSEVNVPLTNNNILICGYDESAPQRRTSGEFFGQVQKDQHSTDQAESKKNSEQWLSQVEINTYAGPHRRLWMGPQFSFKTIHNSHTTVVSSNSPVLLISQDHHQDSYVSTMNIVEEDVDLQSLELQGHRSSPVAMPGAHRNGRRQSSGGSIGGSENSYPSHNMMIETGSYGSSPHQMEDYHGGWSTENPASASDTGDGEDVQKELLADAMIEAVSDGGAGRDGGPNSVGKDMADLLHLDSSSTSSFGSAGSSSIEAPPPAYSFTYSHPPTSNNYAQNDFESPAKGAT